MTSTKLPRTIEDIKRPVTVWDYFEAWKTKVRCSYISYAGKKIEVK